MKTADFFNLFKTPAATLALASLLAFHSATAWCDSPSPESFNQATGLILNLPDAEIKTDDPAWSPHSLQTRNAGDASRTIAGGGKKTPINVNCGMDIYQNAAPEISLSNRLSGECDLKYHF